MRNSTQVDRKPTAPQARWINEAIDGTGSMAGRYRANLPERSRQIMIEAGWLVEVETPGRAFASEDRVTDEARIAVGRADTVRIPDVIPGDVLVYRTHPGCAFRVTEVVTTKYGQGFIGTYLAACPTCASTGIRAGHAAGWAKMPQQAFAVRRPRPSEVANVEVFEVNDRWAAGKVADKSQWTDADHEAYAAHVEARTAKRREAERVTGGEFGYFGERAPVLREGPVAAAEARTGAIGARTLIPTTEAADVAEGQALAAVAQAARANGCPPLCDASAVLHLVYVPEVGNRDFWPADPVLAGVRAASSGFSV